MIRTLLVLLALAAPVLAQSQGLTFSLAGSGMTVAGTLTTGSNTMAGAATLSGNTGTFGPGTPLELPYGGIWWKFKVKLGQSEYVVWIGTTGGPINGYWYLTGNPSNASRLL